MRIRIARESDREGWDNYVLAHPEGVAYHRFAWQEAVQRAYGFPAHYLLAEVEGQVRGVLPLIAFKQPFRSPRLVSLPYCDLGGVLADDRETASALVGAALRSAEQIGADGVEIRMTDETGRMETPGAKVRMVMDLPDSAERLLAGFKAKLRSQVKKPARDGLRAELGGAGLVAPFYRVFAENMRALGSPVHSRGWLDAVVAGYGEQCRVGLVTTADGTVAAGGIMLLHGRTVSIPWASALRRYNSLNPNMLLYWTFLAYAADHGFRCFDFGRSTPDSGTFRFKRQWGARPVPIARVHYGVDGKSVRQATPGGAARGVAGALWQKIPRPVCNRLGPVLRRCISL
ncbi:FemAB family XrtA/PEP-CTERM system-associated protein [Geothermobacter hydrogeniphilus]|uniref:BioF2-like acetyltransferase domain-containing protein n=1 Tax=Geothermobacter hydrogeniphilus TaxID=1969733 RepID=A0A1X0YE42_9BACT|nr:FemAB family XrtA/PEP-CTERM system-associated protein [Geothermobacter hydrogeniphilus]ORJ63387.1 hypothetical protein B5V00_00545 [Geothermobacter hydrogeniphilus]